MNTIKQSIAGRRQKGFTLLEVLLVVAIIAILAGIVILAINPNKQLGDSRNSQRSADVHTILNAVHQYSIDNNGIPAAITTTATEICNTTGGSCASPVTIDLGALTTNNFLSAIPKDPKCPGACLSNGAGYMISKSATTGRVTVSAPDAENSKTITVTK